MKQKQNLIINAIKEEFYKHFDDLDGVSFSIAPGRVNLIGEHTDYNNGFVLPMTLDKAVYIAWRRRRDDVCTMYSMNFQEKATWNIDDLKKTEDCYWANYIKGIMQVILISGYKIGGVEGVVFGDVPVASGLSSSAALEIAAINGLANLFGFKLAPIEAVKLAQKAENNFIGVQCGIMDQFVSQLGKKDHALFIDCKSLDYKNIKTEFGDHVLLIVDSKVKRELAKSAYNERRASCEAAVQYFRTLDSNITSLRDVSFTLFNEHAHILGPVIQKRARHVITENIRVLEAIKALQRGDIPAFGELLNSSHQSLKNDYEVSCKELDFIVDEALKCGACGARLTGAGFGGCAVVVITPPCAEKFATNFLDSYPKIFGLQPALLVLKQNIEAKII